MLKVYYFPAVKIRYDLTLNVNTPNGLVSGTSTQEIVHWLESSPILGVGGSFRKVSGESAVVRLDEGRYIFALIDEYVLEESYSASGQVPKFADLGFLRWFLRLKYSTNGDPITVSRENFPPLVSFKDITDPASIFLLDPEHFAISFGQGYELKSITVKVTRKSVSRGYVENALPNINSGSLGLPINFELPFGHPLRNLKSSDFMRLK